MLSWPAQPGAQTRSKCEVEVSESNVEAQVRTSRYWPKMSEVGMPSSMPSSMPSADTPIILTCPVGTRVMLPPSMTKSTKGAGYLVPRCHTDMLVPRVHLLLSKQMGRPCSKSCFLSLPPPKCRRRVKNASRATKCTA